MTTIKVPRKKGKLEPMAVRFWRKVERTIGCWNWRSTLNNKGYGLFGVEGKLLLAHRVSWSLTHDEPLASESLVLHHCDNRLCVRPDHLFIGNYQDNSEDMARKKRGRKSSRGLPYGVNLNKKGFSAQVTYKYRHYHLGTYKTVAEAHAAAIAGRNYIWAKA